MVQRSAGSGFGAALKRKEMRGCPGNQELEGLVRSSPSQHSDLVLDAALLPLESLFRDALDGKHVASQPLLGQDDLRKGSSAGKEEICHSPAGREKANLGPSVNCRREQLTGSRKADL